MDQKNLATAFEMSALVISVAFGYVLGCTYNWGIWAVEVAYLGGTVILLMEYHFYFKFGSRFAEYRSLIAEGIVDDSSKGEDDLVDTNEEDIPIIIKNQIEGDRQEIPEKSEIAHEDEIFQGKSGDNIVLDHATNNLAELDSLRTYSGFIKFSSYFAVLGLITAVAISLDRYLISLKVNIYEFAAFSTVNNLMVLGLGLNIGFSSVICVDLSEIMMAKDIPHAKRYIKISI